MTVITLLKDLNNYGAVPLSLIMICLVSYLLQQIKKNGEDDKSRYAAIQTQLKENIGAVQKQLNEAIASLKEGIEKRLDGCEERIKIIEKDYVQREDFYRDTGGWRTELNNLSNNLNFQITNFMKEIISLWKNNRGGKNA
jgi:hypothetical protein